MSTVTIRIVSVGFVLFLFLPLLGRVIGVEPEAIENRQLAEPPAVSVATLLETELYREMTSYLVDTLPWRKHAVTAAGWLNLKVFGDSPNPDVHLGRDGWYFLDAAFKRPCQHDVPVSLVIDKIGQLGRHLEESGRQFRFLITPNKHSIYPEFMGAATRRIAECSQDKRAELRRLLERERIPGYIDLFEPLEEMKRDRPDLLYFPNDSHLNALGSSVQSAAIVDSLNPGLWEGESLAQLPPRPHTGDLTNIVGFPSTTLSARYQVNRKNIEVVAEDPVELVGGPPLRRFSAFSRDSPLVGGSVLVIHDSQMNLSMPMLESYFSDISFLHVNTVTPSVALPLVGRSDVVVLQLAERGVYIRIAHQLGSADLLEGLGLLAGDSVPEADL